MLVLCTGNRANTYSAGVETHGVNPLAVRVMQEDGIDISGHTSNHVDEYASVPFDVVLTVCDHAKERCPYFPQLPGSFTKISLIRPKQAEPRKKSWPNSAAYGTK